MSYEDKVELLLEKIGEVERAKIELSEKVKQELIRMADDPNVKKVKLPSTPPTLASKFKRKIRGLARRLRFGR